MKDSICGLKLLGSLYTIAIAHLWKIFDWTTLGRTILLSILEKLKHNKIMLYINRSDKLSSLRQSSPLKLNNNLIWKIGKLSIKLSISLRTFTVTQCKCCIASQTVASIAIVRFTEDAHRRTSI
jgi:hypothetical protein